MTREFRVYGPPGTGKTTYLGHQVERAAEARGRDRVRIASLTRSAAAEIGGRVDLPKEAVGTLHSHAFHALGRPELAETREGVRDWNQRVAGIPRLKVAERVDATVDDAAGEALVPGTEGDGLLAQYGVLRARCTPREAWPASVREFAVEWEQFKRDSDRLDFTDLIERAIDEVPELPGAPEVFLLDEAQDMSRLEMRLARSWGERCDTFIVVGDPDQNLYQWRGTDPAVFADVDLHDDRVRVLEQSYRVPRAVHAYATSWLEQQLPSRSGATYLPRDDAEGRVRRGPTDSNGQPATWTSPEVLVRELVDQAEQGQTVMVLAACGFMLEPLVAVLKRAGVPFHNPYRTKHGGWNPLRGAGRVVSFLRPSPEVHGDSHRMWTWGEVQQWMEPLKAAGLLERGGKAFIDAKCAPTTLLPEDVEPADRPCQLDTLMRLLTSDDHREAVFDLDLDWYERNLLERRRGQLAYPLNVARRHGARRLVERPRIVLGTIHSVKGGEADTVYVFPDLSRSGFEGWLTHGWRHDAVARQFYVAFTRARDELVLCEPAGSYAVRFPPPAESEET